MGAKAKDQLSTFLRTARTLTLEFDIEKRDRYGRLLAYVYLNDKTFINKMMLTEGFAQPLSIPPNLRYKDDFMLAARKARQEKKGLWQEQ
jgi:micrococcal nuclease